MSHHVVPEILSAPELWTSISLITFHNLKCHCKTNYIIIHQAQPIKSRIIKLKPHVVIEARNILTGLFPLPMPFPQMSSKFPVSDIREISNPKNSISYSFQTTGYLKLYSLCMTPLYSLCMTIPTHLEGILEHRADWAVPFLLVTHPSLWSGISDFFHDQFFKPLI